MADGIRLAVRIWLPEDAETDPVPAVLEAIPYRKDDWTARRDALQHPYVAGHGYAVVRLDLRGSGSSDGVLLDEYLPQEQDDTRGDRLDRGAAVVHRRGRHDRHLLGRVQRAPGRRAAAPGAEGDHDPLLDGRSLRRRRPLHRRLRAGDRHAAVGAPRCCVSTRRRRTRDRRRRLARLWLERLEQTPPVRRALARAPAPRRLLAARAPSARTSPPIECPVFAVGGWADGYTNAIFRAPRRACPARARGSSGRGRTCFPHDGLPGPAIGFLQECVRWWDRWLKGLDTGIDGRADAPGLDAGARRGRRRTTRSARAVGRRGRRGPVAADAAARPSRSATGRLTRAAGRRPALGSTRRLADARARRGRSGAPTATRPTCRPTSAATTRLSLDLRLRAARERLEMLGFPELRAARDRRPAGRVRRRPALRRRPGRGVDARLAGVLNLTHRESHEHPQPLEPADATR